MHYQTVSTWKKSFWCVQNELFTSERALASAHFAACRAFLAQRWTLERSGPNFADVFNDARMESSMTTSAVRSPPRRGEHAHRC